MKKNYLFLTSAFLILLGCINFNPNGNSTGNHQKAVETIETPTNKKTEEAIEDPVDEVDMQNSPHLKFKNVPIDGTLDKFVARMIRSGFKKERKTADQAVLIGDFAGFKECVVYVETLTDKDLVSRIAVSFPDRDQWEYLYGDYKHLKELLITKYGKPSSCVEKFQDKYIRDNYDRMFNVLNDKCKYETRFVIEKGEIILWIAHESGIRAFIMLAYKDKINGSVIKNHALDDL